MTIGELADLARRYDRTLAEATEVFEYVSEVLTQPAPEGVDLALESVDRLVYLSAHQTQIQERAGHPIPGGWLTVAKRLGASLR